MIINHLVCECCGKEFSNYFFRGGYIDHYNNFAYRKNSSFFGNNIVFDTREICLDGCDIRDINDIQTRLNCYIKWDNISDEMKINVTEKCNLLIEKIQKAQMNAKNIVKNMTMLERKYLIEEAENNCHTPSGNEDGKMWE